MSLAVQRQGAFQAGQTVSETAGYSGLERSQAGDRYDWPKPFDPSFCWRVPVEYVENHWLRESATLTEPSKFRARFAGNNRFRELERLKAMVYDDVTSTSVGNAVVWTDCESGLLLSQAGSATHRGLIGSDRRSDMRYPDNHTAMGRQGTIAATRSGDLVGPTEKEFNRC